MYKNLVENKNIKVRNKKDRVYSDAPYAQELYDAIMSGGAVSSPKDMRAGQLCQAEIISVSEGRVLAQADSSQAIYLDIGKEARFMARHNLAGNNFVPGMKIDVFIDDTKHGVYTGSMEKAYVNKIRQDMFESLKTGNAAYIAKIKSINDGGFICDVEGMSCFMPGSLAAANKITDFEGMIGRDVRVMVETYLEKSDMFVVSVKKYIQRILPTKIKELSFSKEYTGVVTGVLPYGCFVEWDETFTGLLHESEIDKSELSSLSAGDTIGFYLKEVREGNRLILSRNGPEGESYKFECFAKKWEGKVFEGARIKEVKPFGIFLDMGDDVLGMISPREFKKIDERAQEGATVDVFVKSVDPHSKKMQLRAVMDEEDEN
jgi:ribosomal protein S1